MKLAKIPILALPFVAIALAILIAFATMLIDQAHLRGAYQVWQENETFAAAAVALLAAMFAVRPVYLQVRAQSAQAALDLLHRAEAEAVVFAEMRARLSAIRRGAVNLSVELDAFAGRHEDHAQALKDAIAALLALSVPHLRALAERPTIDETDRTKLVALSSVLAIAQEVARELLAPEREGGMTHEVVAADCEFVCGKLAGVFVLSGEITEDIERQEHTLHERVQKLRQEADGF